MFKIINNFLNNDDFFDILKKISSPEINWFFQSFFLYPDINRQKQLSHILLNDLIKKKTKDEVEVNKQAMSIIHNLTTKLKAIKVNKAQLKLISKSENIIKFPFEKNKEDTMTAVLYLNKNNGYTYVEGIGKINSEDNKVVIFPSDTPYFESSSTDEDYKALLTIEYSVN